VEEPRNAYRLLVAKLPGKQSLERVRRWNDIIKVELKELPVRV
jgi:hypothetical protein